jgi:signal transduction histidine kinase
MAGAILTVSRLFALVQQSEDLTRQRDVELEGRRQSVHELEAKSRELQKAQRMARLGSWRWDVENGTWEAAPELRRILEIPPSRGRLQPKDFLRLLTRPELKRLDEAVSSAIDGQRRFDIQLELRPVSRLTQVIHTIGEVVRDESGTAVAVVGMTQDVTESALAAEELVRLNEELEARVRERTAQLEEFTISVSHDLKAPLRVIQGFVDAAIDDNEERLDEQGMAYLRRIQAAAGRLHLLVERLLAYSRLGHIAVEPMPVDLDDVVTRIGSELQFDITARGGHLSVDYPLTKVMGQRDILTQVVSNLLSNAVKFVDRETPPNVRVWTEDGSDQVRLWVEDNGIGVDRSDQRRIFNVFERLHGEESFPGSGMGLAIVERGVRRMSGEVGVESLTGEGSRFWVDLPRAG